MPIKKFNQNTINNIGYYVYRLIDPRDGQTFYVGKGKGNRVFSHINEALSFDDEDDALTLKIRQIREIKNSGLEVIHLIHRWGLTENEAFEVESALIDAFPELSNIQSGHSADRGVTNADTLNKIFSRKIYDEPDYSYIIIKIREGSIHNNNEDIYETVRRSWKVNLEKANQYPYVFAVVNGVVVNIYKVNEWKETPNGDGRKEFFGVEADDSIKENIVGKLIPVEYRIKGNSNPIRYSNCL